MSFTDRKQKLLDLCAKLRENDPSITSLNLGEYQYGKIE
jgi:hypothetical protein